jgi:hypothetical protein
VRYIVEVSLYSCRSHLQPIYHAAARSTPCENGAAETEINKERYASIYLSTTPPLAIKNNRSRLPLLSRRGNLLADALRLVQRVHHQA